MANPLIKTMPNSGTNRPGMNQNPLQFMGQFMQNPVGALRASGYSIPDGMNNPQQIVNYLINNGQINGSKLGQLQRIAQFLPRK